MKILVAVMQLLSENVRTDTQTDMANLRNAPLKFVLQKVLEIFAALANHPVLPEVITIYQLTLPLEKQGTLCGKEAELDHSSHSYFTHCPTETFGTKRTKQKIFQRKRTFCCSKWVIREAIIIFPLISYRFIFGSVLLSQFHGRNEVLQA
jgi:hypothetical protein